MPPLGGILHSVGATKQNTILHSDMILGGWGFEVCTHSLYIYGRLNQHRGRLPMGGAKGASIIVKAFFMPCVHIAAVCVCVCWSATKHSALSMGLWPWGWIWSSGTMNGEEPMSN
jgi:hypothetical protein